MQCTNVGPIVLELAGSPSLQRYAVVHRVLYPWSITESSPVTQGQLKCGATVNCCAFSRNGQLLLCGTAGGTICLYGGCHLWQSRSSLWLSEWSRARTGLSEERHPGGGVVSLCGKHISPDFS